MPDRHDTQVFWDVDACPLPYDDPYLINQKIRSALQKEGYLGDVTIWAYVEKLTLEHENMHKYLNAGMWIIHKVEEGKKTVVNRMLVDILYFGMNHLIEKYLIFSLPGTKIEKTFTNLSSDAGKVIFGRRRETFLPVWYSAISFSFFILLVFQNPVSYTRLSLGRRISTGTFSGALISSSMVDTRRTYSLYGKNISSILTRFKIYGDMAREKTLDPTMKLLLLSQIPPLLMPLELCQTTPVAPLLMRMTEGLSFIHQVGLAFARSTTLLRWDCRPPLSMMAQPCPVTIQMPPSRHSQHSIDTVKEHLGFSLMDLVHLGPLSVFFWPIYVLLGPLHSSTFKPVLQCPLQSPTFPLLCMLDRIGRGLQFGRVLTLEQRFCRYLVGSLNQVSSAFATPEALTHRFSLTARDPLVEDLGPLVVPFPVKSSTAHDVVRLGREAYFGYLLWHRFVLFNALSQFFDWNFHTLELIELGHRSSLDVITLVAYCVQHLRTLSAKQSWVEPKESFNSTPNHLLIEAIIKFSDLIVEVSLTHYGTACGIMLYGLCLRSYMDYLLYFSNYVVISYALNVIAPNRLVDECKLQPFGV